MFQVVICPPKGSNTALNHDLEKVENASLTGDLKEELVAAALKIFLVGPHKEYVKTMTAMVNPRNLIDVYLGFQSFPLYQTLTGWKVNSSAFEGKIQSPWFGENIKPTYYKTRHYDTYRLQFPKNLKDLVGKNGSLVLKLKVDTHENEGSLECVTISKGKRQLGVYGHHFGNTGRRNFYNQTSKNWSEAELFCASNGGHLVSIKTKAEKYELDSVVGGFDSYYAIGARKYDSGWEWFDGSPWNHNNTVFDIKTDGFEGNCLFYSGKDRQMYTRECHYRRNFICDLGESKFSGLNNITYVYKERSIPNVFPDILVKLYQSKTVNIDHKKRRQTGFSLEWKIVNGNSKLEIEKNSLKGCIKTPLVITNKGHYTTKLNIPSSAIQEKVYIEIKTGIHKLAGRTENMTHNFLRKEYFLCEGKWPKTSWQKADSMCERQGGQLASVHSMDELNAVGLAVGGYWEGVWLGGRLTRAGHWVWSDGSPWDFENWDTEDPEIKYGSQGKANNCTVIWDDSTWWDQPCLPSEHSRRIVCQKNSWANAQHVQITSNATKLTFTKENFTSATFHTWWEYDVTNQTLLTGKTNSTVASFEIEWNVDSDAKNDTNCELVNWSPVRGESKYTNVYVIRLANLVHEAALQNVTNDWLVTKALEYKVDVIRNGSLHYKEWCEHGEIQEEYKAEVIEDYLHAVGMLASSEIIR